MIVIRRKLFVDKSSSSCTYPETIDGGVTPETELQLRYGGTREKEHENGSDDQRHSRRQLAAQQTSAPRHVHIHRHGADKHAGRYVPVCDVTGCIVLRLLLHYGDVMERAACLEV